MIVYVPMAVVVLAGLALVAGAVAWLRAGQRDAERAARAITTGEMALLEERQRRQRWLWLQPLAPPGVRIAVVPTRAEYYTHPSLRPVERRRQGAA